jgi:CDP-glycerol glycerophosphotransferase
MIDKLIEGKLLTLVVGSVFRLVEILVRTIHISVRGVRLLVQEVVTSRVDARISRLGKRAVARRTRVDAASVVLISRDGEYTGDAKYIAEELLRRGSTAKITWVLSDRSVGPFPRELRFVRQGTAESFRAIARAKVVVQDGTLLQRSGAVKAPSQQWVQVGDGQRAAHGLSRAAGVASARPDIVLTGSAAEDAASAGVYGPRVATVKTGHARTDLLVGATAESAAVLRKKVLDRLGVTDTGQRFLLYTPARSAETGTVALSGVDFAAVRTALSEKFGGTWEILVRLPGHSRSRSEMMMAGLPAYCRNASAFPDLQELLVVADAGMTDASGWFWDFLLTNRPAFLFSAHPGAGTGLGESPFPLTSSNRELLHEIAQFDQATHERRVAQYLETSGTVHDGAAAGRIVDRIDALLGTAAAHDERSRP